MDQKSRILFVKRYWYAESVSAMAEEFGMTENYAAVKLLRIRNKLKRFLEKEGITV